MPLQRRRRQREDRERWRVQSVLSFFSFVIWFCERDQKSSEYCRARRNWYTKRSHTQQPRELATWQEVIRCLALASRRGLPHFGVPVDRQRTALGFCFIAISNLDYTINVKHSTSTICNVCQIGLVEQNCGSSPMFLQVLRDHALLVASRPETG